MTLTLAEYEARCQGRATGEITPDDVLQAMNLASALGDAYRKRLFEKADVWKGKPRTRRQAKATTRAGGIENSLPRGDM